MLYSKNTDFNDIFLKASEILLFLQTLHKTLTNSKSQSIIFGVILIYDFNNCDKLDCLGQQVAFFLYLKYNSIEYSC